MRTPALVSIVIALHVTAVGAFIFIQGCESVRRGQRQTVENPPPPIMPPRTVTPTQDGPQLRVSPPVQMPPPSVETMGGTTHVVAKGETLSHVAKTYGISWRELAEFNNLTDPNKVRVGQKLLIPPYAKAGAGAPPAAGLRAAPSVQPAMADRTGASEYVVQSGDNLTRIANKYGIKIAELKQANQLQTDMIRVGQKLTIPAAGVNTEAPAADAPIATPSVDTTPNLENVEIEEIEIGVESGAAATTPGVLTDQGNDLDYIVMDGDTLDEIAKLFIVSKQSLIKHNGLRPDQELKVGDVIKIPPSAL